MQLSGLRHLHMHRVGDAPVAASTGGDVVLSSLQQLTYLNITECSDCPISPAVLKHLTALTGLQHLGVEDSHRQYSGQALPGLKDWLFPLTQLTALELTYHNTDHNCSIPAPGFAALPKLRRLCLSWSSIDPAALTAVRGLQHVRLYKCRFHCDPRFNWKQQQQQQQRSQAQAAFFSWLQLQPLTHLSMYSEECFLPKGATASAQVSAAVTASTALRELHCPGLFLQCPPQQQLLQLTALTCSLSSDGSAEQLVRCCPAVQQLELATWLQPELLLPLTALTSLRLPKLGDEQLPQLLQLTRLQALSLQEASISDPGVRQLSALRQLTRLHACSRCSSRCVTLRAVRSVDWRMHLCILLFYGCQICDRHWVFAGPCDALLPQMPASHVLPCDGTSNLCCCSCSLHLCCFCLDF
jgi:hypothetical protein